MSIPARLASGQEDELFRKLTVGTLNCVALSDGYVEGPLSIAAPEIAEDELKGFLADHGQNTDRNRTTITCLLVRDYRGEDVLVDFRHRHAARSGQPAHRDGGPPAQGAGRRRDRSGVDQDDPHLPHPSRPYRRAVR